MKRIALLLALIVFGFTVPAFADSYTIDFSLTSGTVLPTFAAFDYTPGTGFSSFIVVWNGMTFDLALNDNDFTGCFPAPQTPGAPAFALMSQQCSINSTYAWSVGPTSPGHTQFVFREFPSGQGFGLDMLTPNFIASPASGTWKIRDTSPKSVAEPASISMLIIALAGLEMRRRIRRP